MTKLTELMGGRLCIVFALDHYNPLGLIRSLGEAGVRPVFIAVEHRLDLGAKSRYLSRLHKVKTVEEGYKILLEEYGHFSKDERPLLFTSDDRTEGYLDEHYDELKDRFVFFHAGQTGRVSVFMDKYRILECARKHGLKVLDSIVVKRGVVPDGLVYPVITKSISPNVGGWKSDVHICHNSQELQKAYKTIAAPEVLLQRFIEKKNEYCLDGFCGEQGTNMFVATASRYNYLLPGYYSPYMTVSNFKEEELKPCLENMMAEIGFQGIYEIEFLIDQDDHYWFSEINFRNSTWSYAATAAGMPLPVLWAETVLTGKLPENCYKEIPEGFTAMVEPIDYAKRVKTGRSTAAQWLYDFKRCECPFYYNKDDPEPFMEMLSHWDELG